MFIPDNSNGLLDLYVFVALIIQNTGLSGKPWAFRENPSHSGKTLVPQVNLGHSGKTPVIQVGPWSLR